MNPLISIILPTYNGEARIARAIKSVIAQDYKNWELLVISDGSTDGTKAIVERFAKTDPRIIYIPNEKNLRLQKTLNKGIEFSQGEYIARIDDDDVWVDISKLSTQIAFLQENSDYVLVGTDATVVDEEGGELSINTMPKTDTAIRARILSKNCFLHSTILVKKRAVVEAGGYSEKKEHLHVEDYELWLRVGTKGKIVNVAIQSTHLTAHADSLTVQNRVQQAWHVMGSVYRHRNEYPHFLKGYVISFLRLTFFAFFLILPISQSAVYAIQRMYRAI